MIDKIKESLLIDNIKSLYYLAGVLGFIAIWGISGFFYALAACAGYILFYVLILAVLLIKDSR